MSTGDQVSPEVSRAEPRSVVVCGPPGVGKSTVAADIAQRLDGRLLRTDVVRKDLHPDPRYTDEETRAVYDELFDRARAALDRGESVVLDGTFRERAYRERALSVARTLGVEWNVVRVTCAEDVVRERMAGRTGDASDADFDVHVRLKEAFEPVSVDHVTVDNSGDLAETRRRIAERFGREAAPASDGTA